MADYGLEKFADKEALNNLILSFLINLENLYF